MIPWRVQLIPMLKAFWLAMSHSRIPSVQKVRKAWWLLMDLRRPRVSNDIYRQRQERCEVCPIYDHNRQTCGTAGEFLESGEPYGCGCYMPAKARLHVDCWIWERDLATSTMGWPDELNSSYVSQKMNHIHPCPKCGLQTDSMDDLCPACMVLEGVELQADRSRIDWLEKQSTLAFWQGTFSDSYLNQKLGRVGAPICTVSTMDDDGANSNADNIGEGQSFREAIDKARAKTNS